MWLFEEQCHCKEDVIDAVFICSVVPQYAATTWLAVGASCKYFLVDLLLEDLLLELLFIRHLIFVWWTALFLLKWWNKYVFKVGLCVGVSYMQPVVMSYKFSFSAFQGRICAAEEPNCEGPWLLTLTVDQDNGHK